jgi:sec-independent protein translocase protein TatA
MGGFGLPELVIILLLVLLLFGATRLPKLGRALGDAGRELKKASHGDDHAAPPPDPGGENYRGH